MTPEELEAIKARHRRVWKPEFNCHHCAWCSEPMPCDTAVALAEAERLRGVVEERDRQIERMALRYGMRQEAALEGRE